jgi:hypothetical protein
MKKNQVHFKPIRISGSSTVKRKRIKDGRGKPAVQFELNSDSSDFIRDLIAVFSLNVEVARRENSGVSIKRFASHVRNPSARALIADASHKTKKKRKSKK